MLDMSKYTLPLLKSPERPERFISSPKSSATALTPRRIVSIAKTVAPVSPKCIPASASNELVIRKRGFSRCDVANGSVSEAEIRSGYSLRTHSDPLWSLDIKYIKHLREQLNLSSLTGSRNDDLTSDGSSAGDTSANLKYEPLFPLHLYRSKSVIVQLFSDDPYLQQQGRDYLDELISLSRRDDTKWMWRLSFDLTSGEQFADVILSASTLQSCAQTLYRNDGTYVSFMANATVAYPGSPTISSPFLFVAPSNLGRQVYSFLETTGAELLLHCHSYAARLSGDTISNVPEIFLIKSIAS